MHRSSSTARRALSKLPAFRLPALATLGFAALAVAALLVGGLSGCGRAPTPPTWDNPFDPLGPEGGDPLHLTVLPVGSTINLTWNQPQGMGIAEYAISHAVHPDSTWSSVTRVAHTTGVNNFFPYADATPTQWHWFRIQALKEDGTASLVSYATAAGTLLGPTVILNHGGTTVASRHLTVKVVVTRGTSLRVALGPAFATETTIAAAAPGDTATFALDAPTAAQGDTIKVRVRSVDGAYNSAATITRAKVDFAPHFTLAGGGTTVGSRTVSLAVPATGVDQMRFSATEAGLTAASWTAGAAVHTELLLGAATTAQAVWGEFAGDFGFHSIYHITVTPDLLTGASFHLLVPQDRLVTTPNLRGALVGKATLVRWSESADLSAAAWQAHADTLDITLSAGAGLKTIYLQLRNDWADSPVLTDYATLVLTGGPAAR